MRPARLPVPILLLAALTSSAGAATKAFVVESDFSTGSYSTVDVATHVPSCDVASVYSDARVRWYAGRVYVVNRFGADNIQVIDPATNATLQQFSVGNGANPYDIAFASGTKAYVTRYESSDLWIVNPVTGAHTGTVSLAALADADGIPEMDREEMVGPLLFVSLQRVNRNAGFTPTDSALVAVIDTRADTLVDCDPDHAGRQGILLPRTNPTTAFQFDRATSRLFLGCTGGYGAADGGVAAIDPVHLTSLGVVAGEDSLGGDVLDLVWKDANESYAIVSDAGFNTSLVAFSPTTGRKLRTLYAPGGFSLADAEISGGELWVCNSSFGSPGIRVFSTATDLALGSPITCTLPPQGLAFDVASGQVSGVVEPPIGVELSAAFPDPARVTTRIGYALPAPGAIELSVFDLLGRRIRTLARAERPAGRSEIAWDLRSDAGFAVRAGLYVVRLETVSGAITRRLLVVR